MDDIRLYQFSVSHYCEKARWALDYKGVNYRRMNLLVGLHFKTVRRMAPDTTVPVLAMNGDYIQGSNHIIDYLDERMPAPSLTPREPDAARASRDWEAFAGKNLGDPLRLIFYHSLLAHPSTLIPLLTDQGPWYGRAFYLVAFKRLRRLMRSRMQINARTARLSRRVVHKALNQLNDHLMHHRYLVSDRFTRADLSVAALLSPLVMAGERYSAGSDFLPPALFDYRQQYVDAPLFDWVRRMYQLHRDASSQ